METHHFSDIADYHEFSGLPAPEHPLLSVSSFNRANDEGVIECYDRPVTISNDFYSISLKHVISGNVLYGRTKYDFKKGCMLFSAPRQKHVIEKLVFIDTSRSITFHEDFIKGHDIHRHIKRYGFFSYATNEALHLSPKEKQSVESIFDNIEIEYHNNQDKFSKEIILTQIDALLKYANRFYGRQFLHRQEMSGGVMTKFDRFIVGYFESGKFEVNGTPKVEEIAANLHISPRYLSDSLKAETGKTAIEHIHLYLINEAKNLLLDPNMTVAETAYKLGFEYPQYFSRLFKKKVGISPSAYQAKHVLN